LDFVAQYHLDIARDDTNVFVYCGTNTGHWTLGTEYETSELIPKDMYST